MICIYIYIYGQKIWESSIHKWDARARVVASIGCAAKLSAHLYNTRVSPVLAHASQLCYLPKSFANQQRHAILRILHMPGNALSLSTCFDLQHFGGPKLRCSIVDNHAALIRAALQTVKGWKPLIAWLRDIAVSHLPLAPRLEGSLEPFFWDSVAFVSNLAEAAAFFPRHRWATDARQTLPSRAGGLHAFSEESVCLQKAVYECLLPARHPPRSLTPSSLVSELISVYPPPHPSFQTPLLPLLNCTRIPPCV